MADLLLQLEHGTLSRVLVGAPSQELRPVSESPTRKVIAEYFDHELGLDRHPFR